MIRHHPDETLLLAYASGATDEALGLVVATHIAYCDQCRGVTARLEAIGGSLLQDLAPASLSGNALDTVLAKLDGAKAFERRRPCPIAGRHAGSLASLYWRRP